MAREILFRAKHIHTFKNEHLNGTWVHGYLSNSIHIYSTELMGEFLIDPETVCQYTGLTDKNGRKIFEGDIVKDSSCDLYTVNWSDENGMYEVRQYDCSMENFETFFACDCEVIGNIFDNPELMEEN